MKTGVIGAGRMSDALATQWANAGHQVVISGRPPEKAAVLAAKSAREPNTAPRARPPSSARQSS
jgi:8-hydroxy-5-deazaflavin:NADPH oxidoreductase